MSTPQFDDPGGFALLAEGHAARMLAREFSERASEPGRAGAVPSMVRLARYARREASEVADLALERYLRADPAAAARYRKVLAGFALGHSRVAMAASSAAVERRIGPYHLEIIDEHGDAAPLLVLSRQPTTAWPAAIEVHLGDDGVRVALPEPIEDRIVIVLDPSFSETELLARWLRDNRSEIYLL